MPEVNLFVALLGGLLSFLSPCVLPLVPAYVVYLAGASLERFADEEPERRVRWEAIGAACLFVAGFSTVFVTLGAAASSIGIGAHAFQRWLADELAMLKTVPGLSFLRFVTDDPLTLIAGIIIIVMGLHFMGVTRIGILFREKRMEVAKPVGLWGAYVMGLAFAFGWTPCIGPILTVIFAIAAKEATVATGAGLLAVYSLGLGIPFLIAAFAVESFAAFLARFRRYLPLVEKLMGVLLVIAGFSFLFGWVQSLGTWLLDTFPALGTIEGLARWRPF